MRRGQRDPALDAEHAAAACCDARGRAFRMGDAAPGRHQVHGAGRDLQRIAFAVAMHDAAVEQIGHGRKPDVRMRAHVHALAGDELHRSHLIEEDEGTDHLPLAVRQRAAHFEAAEIARARHDDQLQRIAGVLVAEDGVFEGIQLMVPFLLRRSWRRSPGDLGGSRARG